MIRHTFNTITFEITEGNIVEQPECEAIVNAANARLQTGGGVAGAIHRVGDPELTDETRKIAPINPGEAVITSAPNFPNKYIIHCLGPVYGRDNPSDQLLRNCYQNAITLVKENNIKSIAFPAISTGAFGYPKREATKIAITTVMEISKNSQTLEVIRFVLFGDEDYDIYKKILEKKIG